jgi:hypothetical protein
LINSYEPWDVRSIDVTYPLYSSRQYLSVRGVFLPQLIGELKEQGRTFFLDDPHGTLWAILDRATVEAERVFAVLLSADGEEKPLDGHSNGDFFKDLTIYLEAVLLLLARYHPEVHRVTPVYGLCGVLGKGVTVLDCIFEANPAVKRFDTTKEDMEDLVFSWMNTTLSILQCRLSGPISRDDWSDFAAAGGANALCTILSNPLHRSYNHALSSTLIEDNGSAALRAVQREDELLTLSAQLLKNLVVSGSKYALVCVRKDR